MKALLITCTVSEGIMGHLHGDFYQIKRILVPEANNLVITINERNLYVWENFEWDAECEVRHQIDIPDDLVQKAIDFMNGKKELIEKLQSYLK